MDGCSGTWPAVPATALPLHGAPGEELARTCVQVVDAQGRRCRKWPENEGTPIERHRRGAARTHYRVVRAYSLRGVARPGAGRGRWQSCADEDSPERWEGCDVSRARDLCIVCFRGTAGGTSRWAWLACDDCSAINAALERAWGFRPLALGRHSLMNGIGIRGGASPEVVKQQAARLAEFAKSNGGLREWRHQEYRRVAAKFDPLADIPLRVWQQEWPPSRRASVDAFSRLLGRELPLHPPR